MKFKNAYGNFENNSIENFTPAFECPSNCNGCGKNAQWCGGEENENNYKDILSKNGSCTPFAFLPDKQWQTCENPIPEIASNENPPIIWKSDSNSDNIFIFHGCDGSGIQTDCRGDILYFEQFGIPGDAKSASKNCVRSYPSHEPCQFSHPGNPRINFPYYNCGWFNAGDYNNTTDNQGDLKNAKWLLGVGVDSEDVDHIFRNCEGCTANDGLWSNSKWGIKPDKLIAGALNPWVCSSANNEERLKPYTENDNLNCYCDNEPWSGRMNCSNPNEPSGCEPNWSTRFYYCGLKNGYLDCDYFSMQKCDDPNDEKTCWSKNDKNHGYSKKEGSFVLKVSE